MTRRRRRRRGPRETEVASDRRSPARERLRPGSGRVAPQDESLLWTGSFSAKGLIHGWLGAVVLTIALPAAAAIMGAEENTWTWLGGGLVALWVGLAGVLGFQRLNVHYELTDQRLIHRSGILLRRTHRIELIDIDDVAHEQGIIERMFDVGTIELISSDRSHPVMEMPGIDQVEQVAMLIDDARRRERIRRGIHIEQV